MRAKIKATGEIVEVYDFECGHEDPQDDFVAYTDRKGKDHFENGMSFRDDFEEVGESEKAIDWEQVRIKASISALQGFAASPQIASTDVKKLVIKKAYEIPCRRSGRRGAKLQNPRI